MKKKLLSVVAVTMLGSSVIGVLPNDLKPVQLENKAEAASSWKYYATKTGNTKFDNKAKLAVARFTLGAVGLQVAGPIGAGTVAVISGSVDDYISSKKTIYYTDKIYMQRGYFGPNFRHKVTYYKDKAKKNKVGYLEFVENSTGRITP
ncbi:hypothetical protein KYI07_12385 (plasmid) [Macrococcus psychrotolerans]|uniref:Uncharacterized protein n=1 Tax=Macrococcus psychrotolerans TaxID=3039389 RepID=A0AAT9P740_9STAP|nr:MULTISPECIES: hypothetical protein [Macrococcus]QYA34188.1 hypothetical protein KYI10_12405 [Macrococcus sp. 19Msa1099]QYA38990.1 hypothetical protein KYI07_12385 [Macrococcus caseolyticus]QYA77731.1 hypothetical protein KYI12_12555 [Macrococcus caseolyticus]